MAPISSIRNLGPKFEAMLIEIGIETAEELQKIGAYEAQKRLMENGLAQHKMYYRALWLGLQGRDWRDITDDEKTRETQDFNRLKEHRPREYNSKLEEELNRLGILPDKNE